VNFCALTDNVGDVATSTDPGNAQASWKLAHIDHQTTLFWDDSPVMLDDISCPSASFCLAVDARGNVLASSDPGGDKSAWQSTKVDGTNALGWVACPSSSFCVALDYKGEVVVSTNPTAGATTWSRAQVDSADGGGFNGLACPSVSLCIAVDDNWNVLTSSDPANPKSWAVTGHISPSRIVKLVPSSQRLAALSLVEGGSTSVTFAPSNVLSCPSTSFCAITSYFSAQIFSSADPASSPSTWVAAALQDPTDGVIDVSCPTVTLCVGSTWNGSGVASAQPAVATTAWSTTIPPAHVTSCARSLPALSAVSMTGLAQDAPTISFTVSSARGMLPLTGLFLDPFDYGTNNPDGLSASSSESVLANGVTVTSLGRPLKVNTTSFGTFSSGVRELDVTWQPPASTVTVHISSPAIRVTGLVPLTPSREHETISADLMVRDQVADDYPGSVNLLLPVR
jgi:hypothetical protein